MNFVCSTHINFKAIVQYGDCDLAKKLEENKERDEDSTSSRILTFLEEKKDNSSMKNLEFVKFLLEVVEEILTHNKEWIIFHSSSLIYF